MITFKQITKASAIASLSDYYVLDVRTTGPNPAVNAVSSVSMLQVEDDLVIQEAVVRIASESDAGAASESGYYQAKQVADSMSRILTDQVVVAEPPKKWWFSVGATSGLPARPFQSAPRMKLSFTPRAPDR